MPPCKRIADIKRSNIDGLPSSYEQAWKKFHDSLKTSKKPALMNQAGFNMLDRCYQTTQESMALSWVRPALAAGAASSLLG
jgi:hypothetical protein